MKRLGLAGARSSPKSSDEEAGESGADLQSPKQLKKGRPAAAAAAVVVPAVVVHAAALPVPVPLPPSSSPAQFVMEMLAVMQQQQQQGAAAAAASDIPTPTLSATRGLRRWSEEDEQILLDLKLNDANACYSKKPGMPGTDFSNAERAANWEKVVKGLFLAGVDVSKSQARNKWEAMLVKYNRMKRALNTTGGGISIEDMEWKKAYGMMDKLLGAGVDKSQGGTMHEMGFQQYEPSPDPVGVADEDDRDGGDGGGPPLGLVDAAGISMMDEAESDEKEPERVRRDSISSMASSAVASSSAGKKRKKKSEDEEGGAAAAAAGTAVPASAEGVKWREKEELRVTKKQKQDDALLKEMRDSDDKAAAALDRVSDKIAAALDRNVDKFGSMFMAAMANFKK
jgi:hypothetical protein